MRRLGISRGCRRSAGFWLVICPPERAQPHGSLGRACLEVDLVAGQSSVTRAWAVNPIKLLTPRSRGPSVWTYTSNFGGGFVAGDCVNVDIRLGAGTRCFFGSQASTKVYRNPDLHPCRYSLRAEVGAAALLILAPDPIQCFADSIYEQRQEFHLDTSAGLVLVDWLSAGRTARGERWAFRRFESRNEVFIGSDRLLLDSLRLDSDDGPIAAAYRMGRFNCLATVVLAGAPLGGYAARLVESVASEPLARHSSLVASASSLGQGAVLRFAGTSVEQVTALIARHLSFVRDLLDDDPWARKW